MNTHAKYRLKKAAFCVCCHELFGATRSDARYCDNCKREVKLIIARQCKKKTTVQDDINTSDFLFKTDLCDMDCANCKHKDCILPEDEE